ncbi:MAG: hypothetical protein HPY65_08095 [Syntrophaceae bacterium]|nr:hypothetical protein [Syntrophaceae bacterium]
MKKTFPAVIVAVLLAVSCGHAFGETAGEPDIQDLVRLAPRISLEDGKISTFEVRGTLDIDGILLRFMVAGKQPGRHSLYVLDPRDGMPILVGAGKSYLFYDPVASEVLLGKAAPQFVLRMDSADESLKLGFGVHQPEDGKGNREEARPDDVVVDLRSVMAGADQAVGIAKAEGNRFVVEGKTRRGGRFLAYVTPSRSEGPFSRVEFFKADINAARPFLVLDEIALNRPLPDERFALSEEKLLAAVPAARRVSDDMTVKRDVSLGAFYQALVTRFVLADPANHRLKPVVEKMARHVIDWEQVKKKDAAIAPVLMAVFKDLAVGSVRP